MNHEPRNVDREIGDATSPAPKAISPTDDIVGEFIGLLGAAGMKVERGQSIHIDRLPRVTDPGVFMLPWARL